MTSGNSGECVMTSGTSGECVMTSSNYGVCPKIPGVPYTQTELCIITVCRKGAHFTISGESYDHCAKHNQGASNRIRTEKVLNLGKKTQI